MSYNYKRNYFGADMQELIEKTNFNKTRNRRFYIATPSEHKKAINNCKKEGIVPDAAPGFIN